MKRIPNYALYGEAAATGASDFVHVEWMPSRAQDLNGEIAAHHHSHLLQLLFVQRGRGAIQIETQWQSFNAPCLILLPCHTVHAFRTDSDTQGPVITAAQPPLESILRLVAPQLLPRLLRALVLPLAGRDEEACALWSLLEQVIVEIDARRPGYSAAVSALLVAVLIQIERLIDQPEAWTNAAGEQRLLQRFRALVERHFRQHWRLDLYAETLGVSSSKLARVCRREIDASPLTLINTRLLREARRQLAHSEASVKQIAVELGFADVSYFSRFFRKHCGISPAEFRAQSSLQPQQQQQQQQHTKLGACGQ